MKQSTPLTQGMSRLRVKPAGPAFTHAVFADLTAIRETASGRAVFRRLRDAGVIVTIERPDPPTEPPNAWTRPREIGVTGSEIVIVYDPANWPSACQPNSGSSDIILFGRLDDAAAIANGLEVQAEPIGAASAAMEAYMRERLAPLR